MQDDNVLEICLTTLNILNSAELHFKMVKKVHFVLCIFTTIKKKKTRNANCPLNLVTKKSLVTSARILIFLRLGNEAHVRWLT